MSELQPIPRHQLGPSSRVGSVVDVTPGMVTVNVPPGAGLKRDYAGVLEYWQMVRRHKAAVIVVTLVGGLLGFMVTLSSPRVYQARATLEVQGINEEFLNMKSINPVSDSASGYDDTDLQTQVKILQSRAIIDAVAKKIDSGKRPEGLEPPDRLGMWRKALRINPPSADALWSEAVGVAAGSVRARVSGMTRIVDVSCDSTNPQVAADFCNTLTQEYIDQSLDARWKTAEYTGQWLTKQLGDLKIKMEKQEEDLQSYASATGLVVTGGKDELQDTQVADLQKELSSARADRIAKQSKYEMVVTSPTGALSEVLDDPSLKDSQRTLADLQARLAQLRVTYTADYSEVKKLQAQMSSIQSSLETSRSSILTRIQKEYEAADRREKLLESTFNEKVKAVSGKAEEAAHYNLLKRDVDATRLLYESLLQRLKEASIASALRANNVRVVDAAERPGGPYKPDVSQRCMVGLFFGMILGVAFAVVRERADRTLQDPGDVTYYLGLQELGVVPTGELNNAPAFRRRAKSGALMSRGDSIASGGRVELISWSQKTSLMAESFRTTLTSILFSQRTGDRPRVLVFTSASPKEGKTTVVTNLSITLAEINHRVLVIDGDMRRPRIHSVFGVENGYGLSNLLLEKAALKPGDIEPACVPTQVRGLFVMPSGTSRSQASTLVHSPRLAEVLRLARQQFDTVIVDTPPMINIADARVIARLGDALILVVRSGSTARDAAQLAKARFEQDGTPILGSILNFWNPMTPGYGYHKHYYAGYAHYYGDGGKGGGNAAGNEAADSDESEGSSRVWKPGLGVQPPLGDTPVRQESES